MFYCGLVPGPFWSFRRKKGYTLLSPVTHSQSYSPLSPFAIVVSLGLKLQVRLKEVLVCSQPPPYILSLLTPSLFMIIFIVSYFQEHTKQECWNFGKALSFVSKLLVPTEMTRSPPSSHNFSAFSLLQRSSAMVSCNYSLPKMRRGANEQDVMCVKNFNKMWKILISACVCECMQMHVENWMN